MGNTLEIITIVSAILVILLILLQQRGASLGSGSSEIYTTRRGLEKSLFNTTIVLVLIFVFSILGILLIPA